MVRQFRFITRAGLWDGIGRAFEWGANVKAYLVQKDINDGDYERFVRRAADEGAGLVCFGELAVSGCLYEPRPVTPFDRIIATLGKYPVRVLIGTPRRTEDGFFNSYVYQHEGRVQVYNKVNLFPPMNEQSIYTPGRKPGVFETDFGRIGVSICYDIRFPEVYRELREAGVERLFVPAAFPRVRIEDWKRLLVERAKETGLPVIGINSVGDDGENEFGGSTMVVSSDGQVLAQADETSEQILEVTI